MNILLEYKYTLGMHLRNPQKIARGISEKDIPTLMWKTQWVFRVVHPNGCPTMQDREGLRRIISPLIVQGEQTASPRLGPDVFMSFIM